MSLLRKNHKVLSAGFPMIDRAMRSLERSGPKPATQREMRQLGQVMPFIATGQIPLDSDSKQATRRFLEAAFKQIQQGKTPEW